MRSKPLLRLCFLHLVLLQIICFAPPGIRAQESAEKNSSATSATLNDSMRQMEAQIAQLQTLVYSLKDQVEHYRAETSELQHELQITQQKLSSITDSTKNTHPLPVGIALGQDPRPPGTTQADEKSVSERVARLEENQQLSEGKIDEQYQTKVESASKYRVKLSGLLLMNIFSSQGYVDHLEVPGVALATTPSQSGGNTGGSFGATFRQSEFGLQVFGPTLAGAKTRGDFVADFFGEFPETINGWSAGSLRIRTGTLRLDWPRTSIVAGLDSLFFSPSYPTSFAAVGIPALSYSGNLWGWLPQLRVEHQLISSAETTLTISGAIVDPLTGEAPPNEFLRQPGAGESARQPGYGGRLEWSRRVRGKPLVLGVGGYYNRENWGGQNNVNGWVATTDWDIPLTGTLSLSGKFYRGSAIGGLGAGIGRSIVFNGSLADHTAIIKVLPASGGWAQFKFKPAAKLEFNIAAGQDGIVAGDIRGFRSAPGYLNADLTRNRSEFANFIYRPRSNLLFSTEFRTLRTFSLEQNSVRANQLNLIMGVLF
jgi:hypothetical protein